MNRFLLLLPLVAVFGIAPSYAIDFGQILDTIENAESALTKSVEAETKSEKKQSSPPPRAKANSVKSKSPESVLEQRMRDFAFLFYDKTPNTKKLAKFYDIQDEKLKANFKKEILKAREKGGFCEEGVQDVLLQDSKIRMSSGFYSYGHAYADWHVKCVGGGQYYPPTAPSNARVWIKYGDRNDWLTPAWDAHYMPALEFIYRLFVDKNADSALDMIDGSYDWEKDERQKNKAILEEKAAAVFKDAKDNFQCNLLDSVHADGNHLGILKPFSGSPVEWDFVTGMISGCTDNAEEGDGGSIPAYAFKLRVNDTHVDAQVLKEDFVQPKKEEFE